MPRKKVPSWSELFPDPKRELNDYVNFVIDNLTLTPANAPFPITTEHRTREMQIFALTLLTQPKTHAVSAS